VKTIFVVGFFDPVRKALEKACSEHLQDQSIIWIGQVGARRGADPWKPREANLTELSGRFFERVSAGSDSILILLAVLNEHEWVAESVESIIARGVQISSGIKFELKTFKHASDQGGVLDAIAQFGLRAPTQLSCERVRRRLDGRKVLCVSMDGRTSILDSLKRAGFADETITSYFEEERIAGGKNSNLMERLVSLSSKYGFLLYAWEGLRTSTPAVKCSFGKCYEAQTASKVVALFKQWISEGG
jgi:hypothetical protein